jgi:hypothetical protein
MKATLGEYNNYFSFGLFVELTEPLFVKKNWVPQWLWRLVSESRLSYSEHERQNLDSAVAGVKVPAPMGKSHHFKYERQGTESVPKQVASIRIPDGPWDKYYFKYGEHVSDPAYLPDTSVVDPEQGQ